MNSPGLLVAVLLTVGVSFATLLEPWFQGWSGNRAEAANVLQLLLGEGRRLFANHFFVKADVYFHSGYYPSIFDAPLQEHDRHLTAGAQESKLDDHASTTPKAANPKHGEAGHQHADHDEEPDFLGEPRDWIERMGRHFFVSEHTHLDEGGAPAEAREILPWLRLSATLDPNRVETYTLAAFWLRTKLAKVAEAEQFLREGLQVNPHSPEILYELGCIFFENRHDPARARNFWERALVHWREQEASKPEPNKLLLTQISSQLALLENAAGNFERALFLMQLWKSVSANPQEVDKRIAEVQGKLKDK